MRNGISSVVQHINSLHHWLGRDTQRHCIALSTLTASLLLSAVCAFLPAHQVKQRLFGTPYEQQQSAVKTAD